ncbi:MAG: Ribosomal large subunit pseudouridine synthase A [Proteobacteria bacterium]|nr:MAG: Ribosomal large subunit pseudouridine synthase A [Pseudomonadota bacterium]
MNEIEILYQDKYLLVVNKPSGMLSIKGSRPEKGKSLIEILQEDFPSASIVHRLDMDTSGVMVIPTNRMAHRSIAKQFEERTTSKRYEAVVWGVMQNDEGEVNAALIADKNNPPRQKVDETNGKHAKTLYKVIDRTDKVTKLSLTPVTGRSHQLRVHLLSLGFPIVGDSLYSEGEALEYADRLQLHSCMLTFKHPITKKDIKIEAPAKLVI